LGENVVDPFDKLRTSFCWFLGILGSFLAFFVENWALLTVLTAK